MKLVPWLLTAALLLGLSCAEEAHEPEPATCVWPAGRDMVDPRTGEKGVFLTEPEWQQLWDCRWENRWEKEKAR